MYFLIYVPPAVLLPKDDHCYTFCVLNFSAHYLPNTNNMTLLLP